ncbi:hypothetical protein HUE87_08945 [Candidatus Sulfurimonas marisnigri]|uniref:Uncharacterized protein n=1 Tax=Candidatus Sulfurimonas marisnigri TaxID=2740405 RepID=A0A7S7RPZ1_9BACT|nr:hypothetical protein [Candidatus Sulfurimonas marisnigri]QOY54013.1 hypothetical protein HUE87_08945 [Candidatus Sulfurimonas marisnigri]
MKYQTRIDTVSLQIDTTQEDTRNAILEGLLGLFKQDNIYVAYKGYPINQHSNFYIREYHVYANNIVVASVRAGSFSIKNSLTKTVVTTYYISLEFAGLMTYNQQLDTITNNILMKTCAYFNTRQITFKLNGLDISLDLFTKYEHVLALCTKKSPKTVYYGANELQWFDTTSYMEKIPNHKLQLAVQRAYLYDKAIKENLPYSVTRFEVKLQPKFFNKNRDNIIAGIMNALDRYHVMSVPNKKEKQYLMDQYDAHLTLRDRDIKRLKLDNYRCYHDISAIVGFINSLLTVQEQDMFAIA